MNQSRSDRLPVSTVLLVKNSAASLPAYFESMRQIDDIILLDGGSTDATLELARTEPTVRIFPQDPRYLDPEGRIIDFSGVRNAGYALAKHKWILCVDADEKASPELLSEVRRIIEEGKKGVYFARRRFTWRGKTVINFRKSSSDQVRLFHLDCIRGCVKPVHEKIDIIAGSYIGRVDHEVIVPLPIAANVRPKYNRYVDIEVQYRKKNGLTWRIWLRWMLLRNIISTVRMILVNLLSYLIPKPGPRYPFSLVWEQIRYVWLVTWQTMPINAHRG